jgi:hypothetical protein
MAALATAVIAAEIAALSLAASAGTTAVVGAGGLLSAAATTALATSAGTAAAAGTAGTVAGTLGTAAELATAAELTAAGTTGGASAVFPTAGALGQGAATGLAPGVSAGGVTAPGASSLSAAGSQTGNVFSRGLTQAGEILNNPYVQGGVAVAEGGRTYAETGDLGQSFMAGLGAWGVTGGLGSLSSLAGRKLGQQAISQGVKQAIPQIAPTGLTNQATRTGTNGIYNAAGEVPNVGQNIGTDARAFTGAGTDFNMYGGVPQVRNAPNITNLYPSTPQVPLGTAQTPLAKLAAKTPVATTPPAPAGKPGMFDDFPNNYPGGTMGVLATGAIGGPMLMDAMQPSSNLRQPETKVTPYRGPYKPVERIAQFPTGPASYTDTSERQYFADVNPYPGITEYPGAVKAAVGGLMGLAGGGSYDDEAGYDGYADGGEVEKKMATPDMNAIQEYVRGINPQIEASASNPLQSYLDNIGRQQQRPQVPDILKQLQAQQATQTQTPVDSSERNYGFKPITVEESPLGDKYAPYRPATFTAPGVDEHEYQYTDTSKYVYNPETQQMEIPLAVGGLTSLARGGNYLDGPGDGLSDSIRATIGNRQPARLADGEFVISADVVSDIGGGSSKAGAKKLHAMMDRVRQSAHGTKKQVKKINDRKVLAA